MRCLGDSSAYRNSALPAVPAIVRGGCRAKEGEMRYIEITIWHPLDGNFTWRPRFERWISGDGFDFEWLFFGFNVCTKQWLKNENKSRPA
jgi:hypothetical protein